MSKTETQNAFDDSSETNGFQGDRDSRVTDHRDRVTGPVSILGGAILSAALYGVVFASEWKPLERYFLGHPVAIAASILFCVAISILAFKLVAVRREWALLKRADDESLSPNPTGDSPSETFSTRHDAGFVARSWGKDLSSLPGGQAKSKLVVRLREVLMRQSGRGTTKHLSDDLRELSARDADTAHESFALIRIIVWAIPMLGFLGTVIGITQTLGGLDFSNGNDAVDNLKSGLYVAFDTTALGLVLSIFAIFLQFPVERSEQQLLAAIDERVGYLTGLHLPGDEAADDQFALLAQLCDGVRAAVGESLSNQTRLWRQTIDEAQSHWQETHDAQSQSISDAVEGTLTPALVDHATRLEAATRRSQDQLTSQFDRWQSQLSSWQETMVSGAQAMTQQQSAMLDQFNQADMIRQQSDSLVNLQQVLIANLTTIDEANQRIDENLGAAAGNGMADAMMVLARAVDLLTHQVAEAKLGDRQRRAA